jgi:hypothetical protein
VSGDQLGSLVSCLERLLPGRQVRVGRAVRVDCGYVDRAAGRPVEEDPRSRRRARRRRENGQDGDERNYEGRTAPT